MAPPATGPVEPVVAARYRGSFSPSSPLAHGSSPEAATLNCYVACAAGERCHSARSDRAASASGPGQPTRTCHRQGPAQASREAKGELATAHAVLPDWRIRLCGQSRRVRGLRLDLRSRPAPGSRRGIPLRRVQQPHLEPPLDLPSAWSHDVVRSQKVLRGEHRGVPGEPFGAHRARGSRLGTTDRRTGCLDRRGDAAELRREQAMDIPAGAGRPDDPRGQRGTQPRRGAGLPRSGRPATHRRRVPSLELSR